MELIPGNSLITATPEEGRKLALDMALHSIYAIQPDENVLKAGRDVYSTDPEELIASSQVVAIEFATIAAANNYWR
ncbi:MULTISPECIES: hexameric tyrosine-coordinated heme protein [Arthrobacter]|uniref:Hexameric tyrosine-coordinated heme protein n=1 Tax=Arthrobacter caoxuetaonis TaxID=2886935 RepID=A0A9X1MEX9_9MICC|nr:MULTISPECIES: hexameric tyrosine-coordinated heme protein [Arthrobacter]MCC3282891.1 hexameric tyrosine-coordinated heme protein [Arthrobacter caoxuetaonis]MCC3298025.1 hexameric tyrosine-coordinated heme protein [Arthrobacter caoxuetaonis]MCC9192180.1 hexameric tyrosine-coordinated heme protein [Arthrobacter sp. zg-Y916]USQ57038.1 hexameric tyrosine-coordinated heme protein [Arthrobacter caoxuetaonis]